MRFACPACSAPFEVSETDLQVQEPMELDCPNCRLLLLLLPVAGGRWQLGLAAMPELPVFEAAPHVPPVPESPPAPVVAQPTHTASKRDLASVRLDLPTAASPPLWPTAPEPPIAGNRPGERQPSGDGQSWQDFSVMFRADQAKRTQRRTWLWLGLALVVLGALGGWLLLKRSAAVSADDLRGLRDGARLWTLDHAASDGDAKQPGSLLSRKLATGLQIVRRAQLAERVLPAVEAADEPTPSAPSTAAASPPSNSLKPRLDAACAEASTELAGCARKFMVPRPLKVRLLLGVSGKVDGVWASGGGDQHADFVRCLASPLRRLEFPPQELEQRYTCVVR
jgi:hypothetical protein